MNFLNLEFCSCSEKTNILIFWGYFKKTLELITLIETNCNADARSFVRICNERLFPNQYKISTAKFSEKKNCRQQVVCFFLSQHRKLPNAQVKEKWHEMGDLFGQNFV